MSDKWVDDILTNLSDLGPEIRHDDEVTYIGFPVGHLVEIEVYPHTDGFLINLATWGATHVSPELRIPSYDSVEIAQVHSADYLKPIIRAIWGTYRDSEAWANEADGPEYGERSVCKFCLLDIEYIGDGNWHDRGGNLRCGEQGRQHEANQTRG